MVEASERGHKMSVNLICWANLFALIGIGALQIARQMEQRQTGKMHSMVWHYAIWLAMLVVVLGLGASNLFLANPHRPKIVPPPDSKADAHDPGQIPLEAKQE